MKIKIRKHSYWETKIVLHGDLRGTNILVLSSDGILLFSGVTSLSGLRLTKETEIEVGE